MKKTLNLFCFILLLGFESFSQNIVIVENQKLTVANIGSNNYELKSKGELRVNSSSTAITGTINFVNDSAWLILDDVMPSQALASHLSYISVNGQPAVNNVNVRVTNHLRGCIILPHSPTFEALSLYKDNSFGGDEMKCYPYKYYKIPELGSFDNTISSFKLKKGYMATFAQNENGTGYSKVYIADNNDVEITALPVGLNNLVSFVRVFPWRYTTKKGFGAGFVDFNRSITPVEITKSGWFYNWGGPTSEDLTDYEFVPMKSYASSFTDSKWQEINNLNYASHVLGYNEPNNAGALNMTVEQQLLYWPKLMESGMRLGSPAPTNMAEFYEFMAKCDELNYRVDFVALHDYGEGSALGFYNFAKKVHDITGRPIWVTEFNYGGTWTVTSPTYTQSAARIAEIIDKYDTEGIIERYAIFNFDEVVNRYGNPMYRSVFYTPAIPNYTITPIGEAYRDNVSPMAFNPAEAINIPLRLVAPQNLKITNSDGSVNQLKWDNLNFASLGTVFIERASGTGGYVTIAQLGNEYSSFDDDISATGLINYNYRLSVREPGYPNSVNVLGSIDLNPGIVYNVALNKPVFASSVHSSTYPASDAVDGDIETDSSRWVTKSGELPAYIEIDLERTFLINQLKFYTGYQGYNQPVTSFVFQYWNNDRWEDLITETSNTSSTYSKNFLEVSTNKVRLVVNETTNLLARFYEIEVYGRIDSTLGITDFNVGKFNIYPNPTSNTLNISSENDIESLEIIDVNGKSLLTQKNSNSVNVAPLPKGTYFMKLNKKETVKFIKK